MPNLPLGIPLEATEFKDSFGYFHGVVMAALRRKYPQFPEEAFKWISEMMEYCVPGGKLNRGQMVVDAICGDSNGSSNGNSNGSDSNGISNGSDINHSNFSTVNTNISPSTPIDNLLRRKAHCLGWCIEWLQAYFLVADDIMDHSHLRRGRPCRHRVPGVGMIAVNEALLLRSGVDLMIDSEFAEDGEMIVKLKGLFAEVDRDTQMGQLLDLTMDWRRIGGSMVDSNMGDSKVDSANPSQDTSQSTPQSTTKLMHSYHQMVHHKTALYSFYLPYACASLLLNHPITAPTRFLASQLGTLFQAQDDFLDLYGDPAQTGKLFAGTDIEEGKCTWLLCRLLEKGELRAEDRLQLQQWYGKREGVKSITEIYARYGLRSDFERFEGEMAGRIRGRIAELPCAWSQRVFNGYLTKILKRIK